MGLQQWIEGIKGRNRVNKWYGAQIHDERLYRRTWRYKILNSRLGKWVNFHFHRFSTHFAKWMPLFWWMGATAINYFFIVVLTVISGFSSGGALFAGFISLISTVIFTAFATRYPYVFLQFISVGLITSILPAVFAATSVIDFDSLSNAVKVDAGGQGEVIRTVGENQAFGRASAYSFRRIDRGAPGESDMIVPRFDLLGTHFETIPQIDGDSYGSGQNAGHDATVGEGTFCVVPVVWRGWTADNPVHVFAVCENDFRGHVDCSAALYRTYDTSDPYGFERLDNCLNGLRANHEHAVVVGFTDYELKKGLFAGKAVNTTAALHGITRAPNAVALHFKSDACCGGETATLAGYTLLVIGVFLAPLGYYVFTLCCGRRKKHRAAVPTREVMLRRIDVLRQKGDYGY